MQLRHPATVYRQGEAAASAYCVLQGHVKLTRLTRDGGFAKVALLKPGDWFGTLDGRSGPCAETAVAKANGPTAPHWSWKSAAFSRAR